MENTTEKNQKPLLAIIAIVIVILVLIAGILFLRHPNSKPSSDAEVITVSTLQKIINVSELSTFTAVYNGIAQVSNETKPTQIDYYVAYDARVDAGIDFDDLIIDVDDVEKIVTIQLPEVHIIGVTVDISSLDFLFFNEKANTSTVIQEAYKACEADVQQESEQQSAIVELAEQNAINILTALTKPFINQLDDNYTLVIE